MWLGLDEDLILAGQVIEERLPELEEKLKAAGVKYKVQKMSMFYSILVDDDNKRAAEKVMNKTCKMRWSKK